MLKKVLNLQGVKELTEKEQKLVKGGDWSYSAKTGYCVNPSPTCGGVYPVQYPGSWCCER